ncbi:MAG: hypothetical protein ACRCUU_12235, partial [Plesiomonas sp.]
LRAARTAMFSIGCIGLFRWMLLKNGKTVAEYSKLTGKKAKSVFLLAELGDHRCGSESLRNLLEIC